MKIKLKSGDIVKDVKIKEETNKVIANGENKNSCQYHDVGCNVTGSADQLKRHCELSVQQHLNLAHPAHAALVKQIAVLRKELDESQQKVTSFGKVRTEEEAVQGEECSIEDLEIKNMKLKEDLQELQIQLSTYEEDNNAREVLCIDSQERKIADAENENLKKLSELKKTVAKYEKEVRANKLTIGRLERHVTKLQDEKVRVKKEEPEKKNAENEAVSGWVANLLDQNNELRTIYNESRIKIQELQKTLEKMKERVCESCAVLKVERKALEEEVTLKSKQQKKLEIECEKQTEKLVKLENHFGKLQKKHKNVVENMKKTGDSLSLQQKMNKQVQDKLKRLRMIMAINGIPDQDDAYENEEDCEMKTKYEVLLAQYQEERTLYEKMAGDFYKAQMQLEQLNIGSTVKSPCETEFTEPVKNILNYHISHVKEIMEETRKTMKEYAFVTEEFYTGKPGYKCQFRVFLFGFLLGFDFRIRKGCFDQQLKWPFDMDISLTVFSGSYKDKRTCTVKSSDMSVAHTGRPLLEQGNQVYKNLKILDVKDYVGEEDKLIFELVLQ